MWIFKHEKQQSAIGKRAKIIRDQLKGKLINDIWTFFETEEEKEAGKKQEHNKRLIKDRIIRDISTLFGQEEEDYFDPKGVIFGLIITFNMK